VRAEHASGRKHVRVARTPLPLHRRLSCVSQPGLDMVAPAPAASMLFPDVKPSDCKGGVRAGRRAVSARGEGARGACRDASGERRSAACACRDRTVDVRCAMRICSPLHPVTRQPQLTSARHMHPACHWLPAWRSASWLGLMPSGLLFCYSRAAC
jgi:hypothetical protein